MTIQYTPGAVSSIVKSLVAEGAITKGELITAVEGGTVTRTNPYIGIANENNTTAGPVALGVIASDMLTNYNVTSNATLNLAFLAGGQLAQAFSGDGTTSTTGVNVRIRGVVGGSSANIVVSSDSSINDIKLLPLANGNFVVAWLTSSTLKYAVYTPEGTVVQAAATVTATVGTANTAGTMAVLLQSGEFVLIYNKNASNGVAFQRFSAAGVLQGAEVVVEAVAVTRVSGFACANGDFVVYYFRSTATANYKFARYSSTGSSVIAATTLSTYVSELSGDVNMAQTCCELSNGNMAFAACSPTDTSPAIYIRTSAGASVKTILIGSTGRSNYSPAICPLASGLAVGVKGSSPTYVGAYDNNGNSILALTSVGSSMSPDSTDEMWVFDAGNGIAFARQNFNSVGGAYYSRIGVCDMNGTVKGSVLVPETDGGNVRSALSCAMSPSKVLVVQYKFSSNLTFRTYKMAKTSVLGVATKSAVHRGSVDANTKGSYTLPATQAFNGAGGAFDQRTSSVPGTRGFVVGRSAALLGYT